jgi:aerobic carbon-monoxide dehydrogenase medium subunit
VKARAFEYVRAGSVAEVVALLDQRGQSAQVLAGGQSLMPALNMRLTAPELLIDISKIDELRGISVSDKCVRIGALTRHVDIQRSADVAKHVPLLALAIEHVAHAAIRNRGTIGGSIANADPASELPACALALQATMIVEGPKGTRRVAADEFFVGMFETALTSNELLIALEISSITPDERAAFGELARRQGDYALVGLAAHGAFEGGVCERLRLVFFSAGPTPVLARHASQLLIGTRLAADDVAAAQEALLSELQPFDDIQGSAKLRLHLARVLLSRIARDFIQQT